MITSSALQHRFELNKQTARVIRRDLDAAGVKAISLIGPAGSGKTAAIEALLENLHPKLQVAVIVGNLAANRQVERLTRGGHHAIGVVADHLLATDVRDALEHMNLKHLDLVLIEADGNPHSPVEFDLGHHRRVSVFSVAGGDDKATEFPFLVAESDLVLLTKIDLLPFVTFDLKVFEQDVTRLKSNLRLLQLSVQSNQGINQWVQWVESQLPAAARNRDTPGSFDPVARWLDW